MRRITSVRSILMKVCFRQKISNNNYNTKKSRDVEWPQPSFKKLENAEECGGSENGLFYCERKKKNKIKNLEPLNGPYLHLKDRKCRGMCRL